MKRVLGLGKALAVLFWLGVLGNLIQPFASPFAQGLWGVAGALLMLHGLILLRAHARLGAQPHPAWARVQVLLFGAFYPQALAPAGEERAHA